MIQPSHRRSSATVSSGTIWPCEAIAVAPIGSGTRSTATLGSVASPAVSTSTVAGTISGPMPSPVSTPIRYGRAMSSTFLRA